VKAQRLLRAMVRPGAEIITTYKPCDVLMLYGLGGADRLGVAASHLKSGKPFIAWDLGYWDRLATNRKFRLAFNGNHPDSVMSGPTTGGARFESAGLPMGNVSNPDGPILLIGSGPKSVAVWADGWAESKSCELMAAFPDREILYRPKPGKPIERGVKYHDLSTGPIDIALEGISLVVCRHSNVAVDACRLGVPVVCDAGAAAAIYPQSLADRHNQPDEATRLEFLHRLAWWQWSARESGEAWQFIERKLCEYM